MNQASFATASALHAQLAHYTQDSRLLRLHTSLGADAFIVERIEGREELSHGYAFDVTALSTDAHIDLNILLAQPVLLELLTQQSRTDLRPIHGHVTSFARLDSDGGWARYRIRIEPWTAFLHHRIDSYLFQGKHVFDIIEEIFAGYRNQGKLIPAWRLAIVDAGQYKVRDLCTQFDESDWAFVERLLAEEGLFYWFEHSGDTAGAAFGSHRLVIADHNGAFTPNLQHTIRYHRAAAMEKADSITHWTAIRRLATNAIVLGSWHDTQASLIATQVDTKHQNGDVPTLTAVDYPGQRRFSSSAAIERCALRQLEAHEARNKIYSGCGTVRTLAPGTTFVLTDHPIHDADRYAKGDAAGTFAVIGVTHCGRNNLSADVRMLVNHLFGHSAATRPEPPLYSNHFTALHADIPWRPLMQDGRGALLHPKPTVRGIHTGIVVGESGSDLTTERDHRIKVQMHWQRGTQSASRRTHPQGGDNAPGNEQASIWMRVAEAAAGPNFGSSFLPRVGQEVVIDYIEGDIDRPIVTGSLYNGKGQDDALGNQIAQGAGAATGNAPAWFAGSSGDHAHNAVLSGFKTQEIGHSQDGQGGYNALMLDDTTGQLGARLQTTQARAQLNLGHVKRQNDNARRESHGHGAELTTDAFGALRAGQGLLISADARPNANAAQMDAKEAHSQLMQALNLQKNLADTARKHHAHVGKQFNKAQHELPEKTLVRPIESLARTDQGIGTPEGGGAGTVSSFGRPDLVLSSPAGIALLTPQDAHAVASSITITGGIDVSATSGRNYAAAVKSGITLFTYGDAKAGRKEKGDRGIKLHAAHGKVALQAQSAELKAAADKDVNIASTHGKIEAAAKEQVLLTAGGAYIRIGGGNIEIHAPGSVLFKAGMKELSGPASRTYELASLPRSELQFKTNSDQPFFSQQFDLSHLALNDELGFSSEKLPYRVFDKNGTFLAAGNTSQDGLTDRILTNEAAELVVFIGDGAWQMEEHVEYKEAIDDVADAGETA